MSSTCTKLPFQAVIDLTAAIEADGTQTLYLSNRGPAPLNYVHYQSALREA